MCGKLAANDCGKVLGLVASCDAMGRVIVQDGLGRAHTQAARSWKDGIFSILLREYRNAYGMDPPQKLLDGDLLQHEAALALHTNGLLPPSSPLPNPATTCAPQRTVGLAAGTTHCSSSSLPALDINGILRSLVSVSPTPLRWSVNSALKMAACGALPDDILQQALSWSSAACLLRHSRLFLLNSLEAWGLTLCDLLCDTSLARARALWDYASRLEGSHFDGRNTLAHAEDRLAFYVFGLACTNYLARIDNCDLGTMPYTSGRGFLIDSIRAGQVARHNFAQDSIRDGLDDCVRALECAKPSELSDFRARLLSVLAGLELHSSGSCSWMTQPYDLDIYCDQVQALLAMAPCRRYLAHAMPQHRHGLTLAGQLALHQQSHQRRMPLPLHGGFTDKLLTSMLFALWRDQVELLQSLVTSDGCWPEALLACSPSPPSDGSSTPPLVDSSDDEEAWGSGDDEDDRGYGGLQLECDS